MDHSNNILEIDVLKSCVVWLAERGILTGAFSFQGLKAKKKVNEYKAKLNSISKGGNFKFEFTKEGPDVIGVSESELWKIEPKLTSEDMYKGSLLACHLAVARNLPVFAFPCGFSGSELPLLGYGVWIPVGEYGIWSKSWRWKTSQATVF